MSKESALAMTGTPNETTTTTPPAAPTQAPQTVNSSAFSQLAKKETELVRQRQELKREQQALAAEKERLAGPAKQYQEYQDAKTKDPVAAMKMLGFSEQDIFNYMAQNEPVELTPEQK